MISVPTLSGKTDLGVYVNVIVKHHVLQKPEGVKLSKITNQQWREAHRVIDQCKKETAIEKSKQLQNFIKERNRTFWKQTSDYHTTFMHVYVDEKESYYATVFFFEIHTNGIHKIKSKTFTENELHDLLDGISEDAINRTRERESCDCDCECSCYEEEELPKVNIKSITEYQFKKSVQEKILDRYSIGLTFKKTLPGGK